MDQINKFVMNLAAILVFMTAVEIIAPENSMKKYIKFVLGLILIAFMINPIIYFASNGENIITKKIEDFSDDVSKESYNNSVEDNSSNKLIEDNFKKKFQDNLNEKLHEKYPDNSFESSMEGTVDFDTMKFNLKKLNIYVSDNKNSNSIKKVQKVQIGEDSSSYNDKSQDDDFLKDISNFICDNIHIDKDKIVVKYK